MSDTNAHVQLCEKVIIVVMLLHDRSDLLIGESSDTVASCVLFNTIKYKKIVTHTVSVSWHKLEVRAIAGGKWEIGG